MKRPLVVLSITVIVLAIGVFAFAKNDAKETPKEKFKRNRYRALTATANSLGFRPIPDFDKVYGIVADWHKDGEIVSLYCLRDGTAKLFATCDVAFIACHSIKDIKRASDHCVRIANLYYDMSLPVTDFAYPVDGKIYYYLLTYNGVRRHIGDIQNIKEKKDPTYPMFNALQEAYSALEPALDH